MKVSCLCYNRDFLAGLYHDSHNSHYSANRRALFLKFVDDIDSRNELIESILMNAKSLPPSKLIYLKRSSTSTNLHLTQLVFRHFTELFTLGATVNILQLIMQWMDSIIYFHITPDNLYVGDLLFGWGKGPWALAIQPLRWEWGF